MAGKLRRICVADVVERMEVCTIPFFVKDKRVFTIYKLKMRLFSPDLYPPHCDLTPDDCLEIISDVFVEAMDEAIHKHLALLNRIRNINMAEGGKEMEDGGMDIDADEEDGVNGKSGEEGEMDGGDVSDGEGADAQRRRRQENDEMEYEDDLETKDSNKKEKNDEEDEVGTDDDVEEKEEDYMMEGVETEAEEEEVADNEQEETNKVKKNDERDKKKDKKAVKEKKKSKKKKRNVHKESNGLDFEVHFRFEQDDPHVLLSEVNQFSFGCIKFLLCLSPCCLNCSNSL